MNVLGISGTPRKNGNSKILLEYSLKPFKQNDWNVRQLSLSDYRVEPCNGCEKCLDLGYCLIKDDMKIFYESFFWCDALIIASPVYTRNVNSKLLAVLERIHAIYNRKPLVMKPGGAIAVGRGTGGGQANTISQIYTWMLSSGMICVPGELNGVTAKADKEGEILSNERKLRQAITLGNNVMHVADKLK